MLVGTHISICQSDEIDELIPHIIAVESGGDPHAVSKAGAMGLMQITPIVLEEWNQEADPEWLYTGTFDYAKYPKGKSRKELVLDDLYVVKWNKMVGEWYLRRLRDHYLKDIYIDSYYETWGTDVFTSKDKVMIKHKNDKKYTVVDTSNFLKLYKVTPNTTSDIWYKWIVHTPYEDIKLCLILSAYNGGITRLRKHGYDINKMPLSVQEYVKKVMKLYREGGR